MQAKLNPMTVEPGLGASYIIWRGNRSAIFHSSRGLHGATEYQVSKKIQAHRTQICKAHDAQESSIGDSMLNVSTATKAMDLQCSEHVKQTNGFKIIGSRNRRTWELNGSITLGQLNGRLHARYLVALRWQSRRTANSAPQTHPPDNIISSPRNIFDSSSVQLSNRVLAQFQKSNSRLSPTVFGIIPWSACASFM